MAMDVVATTPSTAANATISFFEMGKFFDATPASIQRSPRSRGAAGDIGAIKNGDLVKYELSAPRSQDVSR
jgi:hypothetical protein